MLDSGFFLSLYLKAAYYISIVFFLGVFVRFVVPRVGLTPLHKKLFSLDFWGAVVGSAFIAGLFGFCLPLIILVIVSIIIWEFFATLKVKNGEAAD